MNIIKQLRQKMGLTQVELAKELNISQGSLSSYETGRNAIDNDMLVRFARYFGVTVDELLGVKHDELNEKIDDMSAIEYALSGEIRNLSEDEMQDVLDYVRFKRAQKLKKQ